MIQRTIIVQDIPLETRLAGFDYFNDYKDTRAWVENYIGGSEHAEILEALDKGYAEYMKPKKTENGITGPLMDWSQPGAVSTQDLDDAIREMCELEEDYEAKKRVSSEAHGKFELAREKVLLMLQGAGKTKYFVEGFGTASMALKFSVKVPQDPNLKKQMLDYFLDLGPDVSTGLLTVNHQTLNSYVKQKAEENPEFRLPGVGERKEEPELRFRRTRE